MSKSQKISKYEQLILATRPLIKEQFADETIEALLDLMREYGREVARNVRHEACEIYYDVEDERDVDIRIQNIQFKDVDPFKRWVKIDDVIACGNKLYYELNPGSKMDVPSMFYEMLDSHWETWYKDHTNISFYEYCKSKSKLNSENGSNPV
jgi:hypothetical protein